MALKPAQSASAPSNQNIRALYMQSWYAFCFCAAFTCNVLVNFYVRNTYTLKRKHTSTQLLKIEQQIYRCIVVCHRTSESIKTVKLIISFVCVLGGKQKCKQITQGEHIFDHIARRTLDFFLFSFFSSQVGAYTYAYTSNEKVFCFLQTHGRLFKFIALTYSIQFLNVYSQIHSTIFRAPHA